MTQNVSEIAPAFVKDPDDVQCFEGDEALFQCSISKAEHGLVWFLNDRPIDENFKKASERVKLSATDNGLTHILCISAADPANAGYVHAVCGTDVHSRRARLKIEPLAFTAPPQDVSIFVDETAVFSATVNKMGVEVREDVVPFIV